MKSVKERLKAGETITVCNTDFPTPRLVEYVGSLGFDVVFIDCEHASTDFGAVEDLARAARASGMTSVVRPWSNEEGLINRYLSCGVDGIQAPHVANAAEGRAILDGMSRWEGDHTKKMLVAMIESTEAIEDLPRMIETVGADVFYLGALDLAQSMGLKGNAKHPSVRVAVENAIAQIAAAGRVAGLNVQGDLEAVTRYRNLGLRWVNVHLKTFVEREAPAFLNRVRS